MVGKLIDNLKNSRYAKNTIVVISSDHGWQLGEDALEEVALWENIIRTLLMVKVPENISSSIKTGSRDGGEVNSLTSLLDIYPTLIELANIKSKTDLDGKSLIPLLNNPELKTNRKVITTYDFADYSLRYNNWHYINYVDGSGAL